MDLRCIQVIGNSSVTQIKQAQASSPKTQELQDAPKKISPLLFNQCQGICSQLMTMKELKVKYPRR